MSDSESINLSDLDDDFVDNNKQSYIHKPLCYVFPIWHPYSRFKIMWNAFIVLILLFSSIMIPFALAFDLPLQIDSALGISMLIMDLILCVDIVVTFRTAFYDEYDPLLLITCPVRIASEYLKFWFWFDLITSFPFDFMIGPASQGFAHYMKILRFIRLIRIFRIFKVLRIVSFTHAGAKYSPALIYKFTICKILFAMAFISHLFACLWWAVGTWMIDIYDVTWVTYKELDSDNISLAVKYSTSMYWSVITLFTTGYGDITATNTLEQWVCIFCVAAGSCVSAWFIGAFSALVLEGSSIQHTQREAVDRAKTFCNQFQFDDKTQRAIISHTKYYYHYNYQADSNDEVMNCLPLHLQNNVRRKLARRSLKQIDLFKNLSDEVLGNIVLKIKSVACNAGYFLYKKGEIASELYICRKGKSILITDKHIEEYAPELKLVKPEHVVGEYCLAETKRSKTLKCLEWSEFMVISKGDIIDCINDYYERHEADTILNEIITKLKSKEKRRKVKLTPDEKLELHNDESNVNARGVVHDDSNTKINVNFESFSMSDHAVVNIERRKLKRVDRKRDVYEEKDVELISMNDKPNSEELFNKAEVSYGNDEWSSVSDNDEKKEKDIEKKVKGKKRSFFKMNFFKKMGKKNKEIDKNEIERKPPDVKGNNNSNVHTYQKTGQQSEFEFSDSNDINSNVASDSKNEQSNKKT